MHSSNTTTNLPVYVKVTYAGDARMVGITACPSFAELESQVKKSFGLGERYQLDLRYIDEDQDRVCLSSDEELRYALDFFQGKTLRLFLATKIAEESPDCFDKKTNDDTAKHEEAAQELKKRLDEEGFDVPEKRCRKLVAKWNGNVDLAEEAVRLWRQRKAARTCELLPPPGFFHKRHGPHRHCFEGHRGSHHPHQLHPRHHRHHHVGDSDCGPQGMPHHFGGHHHRHGPHHEVHHQLHSRHRHHHVDHVGDAECQPQATPHHFGGHHHRHGPRHHHVDQAECEPFGHHDHKWKRHHHQHSRQIEALLLHRMAKRECGHQAFGCPKGHHGLGPGRHHHAQLRHCRGHHGPHHQRPSFFAHPPGFALPPVPGPRFRHCFA